LIPPFITTHSPSFLTLFIRSPKNYHTNCILSCTAQHPRFAVPSLGVPDPPISPPKIVEYELAYTMGHS
jgi:hypothetical protein